MLLGCVIECLFYHFIYNQVLKSGRNCRTLPKTTKIGPSHSIFIGLDFG